MLIEQQFPARGMPAARYVPVELWPAPSTTRSASPRRTGSSSSRPRATANRGVDLDAAQYGSRVPATASPTPARSSSAPAAATARRRRTPPRLLQLRQPRRPPGLGRSASRRRGYGGLFDGGSAQLALHRLVRRHVERVADRRRGGRAVLERLPGDQRHARPARSSSAAGCRHRHAAGGEPPGHIGPLPNLRAAAADFARAAPRSAPATSWPTPRSRRARPAGPATAARSSRVAATGAPDGGWVARAPGAPRARATRERQRRRRADRGRGDGGDDVRRRLLGPRRGPAGRRAARPHRRCASASGAPGAVVKETVATSTLGTAFARLSVAAVAVGTGNRWACAASRPSAVAATRSTPTRSTLAPAPRRPAATRGRAPSGRPPRRTSSASRRSPSPPRATSSRCAPTWTAGGAAIGSQPVTGVLYAGTRERPGARVAATQRRDGARRARRRLDHARLPDPGAPGRGHVLDRAPRRRQPRRAALRRRGRRAARCATTATPTRTAPRRPSAPRRRRQVALALRGRRLDAVARGAPGGSLGRQAAGRSAPRGRIQEAPGHDRDDPGSTGMRRRPTCAASRRTAPR